MTVTVEGTLRVKIIHGTRGAFSVGDLTTSIGAFSVKDSVLDQFEEGVYTGRFVIERIFPWSYSTGGRSVIEVRARLADLMIDDAQDSTTPAVDPEPDPVDEPSSPPVESPAANCTPEPEPTEKPAPESQEAPASASSSEDDTDNAHADLIDLFGDTLAHAVSQRQPVKLDPTVDRLRFRQQRDHLKNGGCNYAFLPDDQTWYPVESEAYQAFLSRRAAN